MALTTISEKGQLIIPKEFRIKYGLEAKSQVQWVDTGQGLMLIPVAKDPVKSSRGMLKGTKATTEALLEARKTDKELEDKKSEKIKR